MHQITPVQVVQRRGELHGERRGLLHVQPAEPANDRRQARAFRQLEHQERTVALSLGIEQTDDHGMVERGEDLGFPAKTAERRGVVHVPRPQHLDHHDVAEPLVEGHVGLVATPSSEQPQGVQPLGDLVALGEPPTVVGLLASVVVWLRVGHWDSSGLLVGTSTRPGAPFDSGPHADLVSACRSWSGRWCRSGSSLACPCQDRPSSGLGSDLHGCGRGHERRRSCGCSCRPCCLPHS